MNEFENSISTLHGIHTLLELNTPLIKHETESLIRFGTPLLPGPYLKSFFFW